MRIIAVTPTWNEAENLRPLLRALRSAVPGLGVVVVDDGSPDGTADLAQSLSRAGDVRVLRREGKQGLASAYFAGFAEALAWGADRVVQLDADLSHDPRDIPRLVAQKAGLVLGSRNVPGGGVRAWPLHRQALSRFGSWYTARWHGDEVHDWTGGFKAWTADALSHAIERPPRADGYAFQVEMTLRALAAGERVVELPIVFTERQHGVSKMNARIALEAALLVPWLKG